MWLANSRETNTVRAFSTFEQSTVAAADKHRITIRARGSNEIRTRVMIGCPVRVDIQARSPKALQNRREVHLTIAAARILNQQDTFHGQNDLRLRLFRTRIGLKRLQVYNVFKVECAVRLILYPIAPPCHSKKFL